MNCEYWSCNEDDECLTATEMEEAIDDFLNENDDLPAKLTVYGFNHVVIDKKTKDWLVRQTLEDMLERLDDEYGNPDDNITKATEETKAASKEFVDKIVSSYYVWRCDQVAKVEINMAEWLKEHDPELLDRIKVE